MIINLSVWFSALQCGKNEEASDCAIVCPPQTCESMYIRYLCAESINCTAGCNCITNHLRDSDGKCIPIEQCFNGA